MLAKRDFLNSVFVKYQRLFLLFLSVSDLWKNHISIKCHLVLIQTEESRQSGCTRDLADLGPQ